MVEEKPSRGRQSTFTETKELLRRFNIKALKGLGQHFLVDRSVLRRMVSAADLLPSDIVVEIGPGLGILTEELVRSAGKVIAIEVDSKMAFTLAERFSHVPKLTIINADVLKLDTVELIMKHASECSYPQDYKVVANLPYNIAAPVLRRFLEASLKPNRMVVMVQKEVGQSMVAAPGRMGLLSLSIQLYGKPTIVGYVPARSFYPKPKVNSAIVRIDIHQKTAVEVEDIASFFTVVKAGFSAPRKQLRNSLAQGMQMQAVSVVEHLKRVGIAPERRPQTLSLEEWVRVCHEFTPIRE
ncbi:16S rRNA (adenine(1518)-N(6)/adenine(1519)-N(6))-dimethyltransferase RsmA [Chloroflexota bacterium]